MVSLYRKFHWGATGKGGMQQGGGDMFSIVECGGCKNGKLNKTKKIPLIVLNMSCVLEGNTSDTLQLKGNPVL